MNLYDALGSLCNAFKALSLSISLLGRLHILSGTRVRNHEIFSSKSPPRLPSERTIFRSLPRCYYLKLIAQLRMTSGADRNSLYTYRLCDDAREQLIDASHGPAAMRTPPPWGGYFVMFPRVTCSDEAVLIENISRQGGLQGLSRLVTLGLLLPSFDQSHLSSLGTFKCSSST